MITEINELKDAISGILSTVLQGHSKAQKTGAKAIKDSNTMTVNTAYGTNVHILFI